MRIEIYLESKDKKITLIKYNYNYMLSSAIYSKFVDLEFFRNLHESESFKFFNFSKLYIKHINNSNSEGLIANKGKVKFILSSPNQYIITNFLSGCLENPELRIGKNIYKITQIKEIKDPKIHKKEEINTLSPIITRTKEEIEGKLKIRDLAPSPHFFRNLEKNLIRKYILFNNIENTNLKVNISSEMRYVKEKRILIEKYGYKTYNRCYLMNLSIEGDAELIKFAYDTGIGEKNSMGFGMIKIKENK